MSRFLSTLAALIACLVLPVAAASTWIDLRVTSTSGYVDAVTPLSHDADVQHAAATSIEAAVLDAVHLSGSDRAAAVIDLAVEKVVRSAAFGSAWVSGNRVAHRQLIAVLADDGSSTVDRNGSVGVDLGDLLDPVVHDLSGGVISSTGLDHVGLSVDVVDAAKLAKARTAYRVADTLGLYPGIAWVLLVVVALLLPGARRRAVSILGVGSLLGVAVTGGALLYLRTRVIDSGVPVATAVFDAVARSLWIGLGALAVVAVVALLARATLGRRPA